MLRLKKLVIFSVIVFFLIVFYFKNPTDSRDSLKLNDINKKINEIEQLIKTNRRNFELIKNAIYETHLNSNTIKEMDNLKALLNLLQSQSKINSNHNLRWVTEFSRKCSFNNLSSADIEMGKLYDSMDFTDKDGGVWKQGFNIEYDVNDVIKEKLKVFVVPHSHQDPGWIKSFEDYFKEDSKIILDNMLEFLTKESNMTFIHAEVVYFEKWWNLLAAKQKNQVIQLIKNKQLEIVTGGWVMTDEANTHYFSIINQLSEGHLWLHKNLNFTPKSAWAIDPFGHSQIMPYLLKKIGINNMVIQRVHYIVKKRLALQKQLEFKWKQYWDSENSYNIYCHMMPFFSYDVPHTCGPDPSICCQFDFMRILNFPCPWGKNPVEITDSNIELRAQILLDQYRKKARLFDNGNILLVPLGDDFRYKSGKEWVIQYTNYKKLMDYMNKRKDWNVEVKFGILSDYFDSLNKIKMYPTLTGDMFSYADREDHYWTGYFTSRPFLKILDRKLMTILRSTEIVLSLSLIYRSKYQYDSSNIFNKSLLLKKLDESRKALALFQHHDAITGTAKSNVVIDYENRLLNAIKLSQDVFTSAAQGILQNNVRMKQFDQIIFNVGDSDSIKTEFIDLTSTAEKYIYLFNSLSQPRQVFITIPIETNTEFSIKIIGSGNQIITCQLTPFFKKKFYRNHHFVSFKLNMGPLAFEKVRIVSTGVISENNCLSTNIHLYNFKSAITFNINYKVFNQNNFLNKHIIIENSLKKVYINSSTGYIEAVEDRYLKTHHDVKVMFKKYGAKQARETSGAYLFIPDSEGSKIEPNSINNIILFQGLLFDEIIVENSFLIHILRIYKVDGLLVNAIDIENIIDIRKESNFELSMIIHTDFVLPSDQFYVDSNCFQFIRRKTLKKLPIQGNVYPMTCGAYIESKKNYKVNRMLLISKQSNGVRGGQFIFEESKSMGAIEVFLDRILNQDDNRGLYESLIDNQINSKHYRLHFEEWKQERYSGSEIGELTVSGYQLLNDFIYPIQKIYVKVNFTNVIPTNFVGQKSLLTGLGLPCDYHLLNFKTSIDGSSMLTIHRTKLNCNSGYISEGSCKISTKKSPLFKSMFDDLTIKYVNKLQLSGLRSTKENTKPEDIRINLMDIDTYDLYFDV